MGNGPFGWTSVSSPLPRAARRCLHISAKARHISASSVTGHTHHAILCQQNPLTLAQGFSNINAHPDPLGSRAGRRFYNMRCWAASLEFLGGTLIPRQGWYCWSRDHGWRTTVQLQHLDSLGWSQPWCPTTLNSVFPLFLSFTYSLNSIISLASCQATVICCLNQWS